MPPIIQKENPPRLADLQDWLRWVFTEPRGIAAALESDKTALRRPEPRPRLLPWIADGPPINVNRRLAVYADAYFLRLLDSLGTDFKAVKGVLGEDSFRILVADYLRAHPSNSPNIGDVGQAMPSFLRSHPFNVDRPFLADLAALEWNFLGSLRTDRLPPFDPATLKDASPEAWDRAPLILDPTVRLLEVEWPVQRLWKRVESGKKLSSGLSKPGRQWLLIFRDDDWVNVRPIGAMEFLLLQELQKGRTLGEACLKVQETDPKAGPSKIQTWFTDWTASGVVKRIEFPA